MIDDKSQQAINDRIYEQGSVDRQDLLEFLSLINTNDAREVGEAVSTWLQGLHDDPKYTKVLFPKDDIAAILSDLGSYGRLQPETLYELQQPGNTNRELSAQ